MPKQKRDITTHMTGAKTVPSTFPQEAASKVAAAIASALITWAARHLLHGELDEPTTRALTEGGSAFLLGLGTAVYGIGSKLIERWLIRHGIKEWTDEVVRSPRTADPSRAPQVSVTAPISVDPVTNEVEVPVLKEENVTREENPVTLPRTEGPIVTETAQLPPASRKPGKLRTFDRRAPRKPDAGRIYPAGGA